MKTEYNQTNGFLSTNPDEIKTNICARTNSLVLTYCGSNGDQISINTFDYVSKDLFEHHGKLYFEPKTLLENWIVNEWSDKQWRYLTGNAAISNDIIYLQRRDDDNMYDTDCDEMRKDIGYLEPDINAKYQHSDSASVSLNMVELLSFSEFQTRFDSNIFMRKPKYLKTQQTNCNDTNEGSHKWVQFVHLSQSIEV